MADKKRDIRITRRTIKGSPRFCTVEHGVTRKIKGFKGKASSMAFFGCFGSEEKAQERRKDLLSGRYKVGSGKGAYRKVKRRAKR